MPDPSLPPGSVVVAYCRDSGGDSQERSIAQQRQAIVDYCDRHDLALVRVFADEATPGGSADREAFQEMIRWLRRLAPEPERGPRDANAPDGILYWDLRRFGRNQDDSAYFRADLRRRGYELVSLSDGIPAGDLAIVMEAMLAWKAEQDLKELSKDIKRGLYDFVLLRGPDGHYLHCWTGRHPPGFRLEETAIGTRRDGRPRMAHVLVVDPAEAAMVRRAFEMRASGATYVEVHRACRLRQARRAYRNMFENTLYYGRLQYGDLDVVDWIEPIIPRALWDAVQAVAKRGPRPRLASAGYPLSGLLRCGECGRSLMGKTNNLRQGDRRYRYRYYICARARDTDCCEMTQVLSADAVEAALYQVLVEEALTPGALARLMDGTQARATHQAELEVEVARLQADVTQLDCSIVRLVDTAEAGAGAVPALAERLRRRQEERRQAQRALQEAQGRLALMTPEPVPPEVIQAFCEDLARILEEGDAVTVRALLDQVIVKARAWADGCGEVTYQAPWPGGAQGAAYFSWR